VQGRGLLITLLLVCLAGCNPTESEPPTTQPDPMVMGQGFDPANCGTIRGTVSWQGTLPDVPPIQAHLQPQGPPPLKAPQLWPNTHMPHIGPSGEVQGAVVFLRQVDAVRSRPWNHAPVRVEQHDYKYVIHQGSQPSPVGFLRCGDAVIMDSTDDAVYSLHARGAAYFSLRFVEPHKPVERVLKQPGHVELTSGLGCIWMRGHLFVVEHPYYTLTDEAGRFTLPDVPAGSYEVVCWLPNYRETGRDLDPNTALPVRLTFAPPVQKTQTMTILPQKLGQIHFALSSADFSPPPSQ
jgi:hypothetical protein